MGLFNEKKKMFQSLREAGEGFSGAIFTSAVFATNTFIRAKENLNYDNDIYWKLILKFSYFMFHMTDRKVFSILGTDKRIEFIESLHPNLSVLLTNAERKTFEKGFKSFEETYVNKLRQIWPASDEKMNKRGEFYFNQIKSEHLFLSQFKELAPEEGEGTAGTLFWEFAKKAYEEIFNDTSDVLGIMSLIVSATAAMEYLKLLDSALEGL